MRCSKKNFICTLLAVLLSITSIFIAVPDDILEVAGSGVKKYSIENQGNSLFQCFGFDLLSKDQQPEGYQSQNTKTDVDLIQGFSEVARKLYSIRLHMEKEVNLRVEEYLK